MNLILFSEGGWHRLLEHSKYKKIDRFVKEYGNVHILTDIGIYYNLY